MTLYIDLLMLLNFLTDLLLLLAAGHPLRPARLVLAAALGGLYSGAAITPAFSFLRHPCWYLIFFVLISAAAFGLNRGALRKGALFFLLSMALGGMASALQESSLPLLILSALLLTLLTRFFFSAPAQTYLPVTVESSRGPISFTALLDTGNQLRDPITGEPVMVVGPSQAQQLTGLTLCQLCHPMDTLLNPPIPGLRLIPYSAVGQSRGMLLGLRFPRVTLGRQVGPRILAFAPEGLGDQPYYQALTGGSL